MFVKTSNTRWVYFLVLPFLCIGLLLSFNPKRDLAGIKEESEVLHPYKPSVFVLNPLSKNEVKSINTLSPLDIDQYRGGVKNHSYYRVNFSFDNSQLIPKTNQVSIDGASEEAFKVISSPVMSSKYVILQGKKGEIRVYDRISYKLHWSFNLPKSDQGQLGSPIGFLKYAVLTTSSGKAFFVNLEEKKIISTLKIGTGIKTSAIQFKNFVYINSESDLKNNFILKWDITANKVVWTSEYLNSGSRASLVLSDDAVLMNDVQGYLYSVSAETGKTLWTKKVSKSKNTSPVIFQDQVIVVTKSADIISLDLKDGEENWRYKISQEGDLSEMAVHPRLSTGVIRSEEALYKFNLLTGDRTSRLKMKFLDKSNPIIVENNQELHIFTSCRKLEICMFKYKGPQLLRLFTIKENVVNQIGVDKDRLILVGDETGVISVIKKPVPRTSSALVN